MEKNNAAPKNEWIKTAIDLGGPLAFAAAYFLTKDFMKATWVLVGASLLAVVAGLIIDKKIPLMPAIAAGVATLFGGATLLFNDPRILKVKMTILYSAFAAILLFGQLSGRNFLKMLLGENLPLKDKAWPTLTYLYIGFFVVIALVNEYIWRTQTDAVWVAFKGFMFFIFLGFSIATIPYLMKNLQPTDD